MPIAVFAERFRQIYAYMVVFQWVFPTQIAHMCTFILVISLSATQRSAYIEGRRLSVVQGPSLSLAGHVYPKILGSYGLVFPVCPRGNLQQRDELTMPNKNKLYSVWRLNKMADVSDSVLLKRKTVFSSSANKKSIPGGDFSVVTYNILADCHIPPRPRNPEDRIYSFCTDEELYNNADKDSKRHVLLMQEIKFLSSDIFCIQEVENDYCPVIQSELADLGYVSYFEQKVLGTNEGIMTSFRKDKFELVSINRIVINDLIQERAKQLEFSCNKDKYTSLEKDTVALVLRLKDLHKDGRELLICNFHAFYDIKNPDIATLQACLLADKLLQLRDDIDVKKTSTSQSIPVIFSGDFNSEPQQQLYKILTKGQLTKHEAEYLTKIYYEPSPETQEVEEKERKKENPSHVTPFLDSLVNKLPLKSAYKEIMGTEPEATSSDGVHLATLDYIFYTADICVLSVMEPFTKLQIRPGGPSKIFPSDHMSMKATFRYVENED